jgi:hypothetical protein
MKAPQTYAAPIRKPSKIKRPGIIALNLWMRGTPLTCPGEKKVEI